MISEEEFDLIQSQLIKLRTENYDLKSQVDKYKKDMVSTAKKLSSYEKDYKKASTIIAKSKDKQAVRDLVTKNHELKMTSKSVAEDHTQQVDALRNTISILKDQNDRISQVADELRNEKEEIMKEHDSVEKGLAMQLQDSQRSANFGHDSEEMIVRVDGHTQTSSLKLISREQMKEMASSRELGTGEPVETLENLLEAIFDGREDHFLSLHTSTGDKPGEMENGEVSLLKERITSFEKELKRITEEEGKKLEWAKGEIAEREISIARLSGQIKALEENLAKSTSEKDGLAESLRKRESSQESAEKKLLEAEGVISTRKTEIALLKEKVQKKEEEIEIMNEKVSQAGKLMREEAESANAEISALREMQLYESKERERLESELSSKTAHFDKTSRTLEGKVNTLELSLRATVGNKTKYEKLANDREKEIAELTETATKSEKRFTHNNKKMKENDARMKSLISEGEILRSDIAAKQKWADELEATVNALQKKYEDAICSATDALNSLSEVRSELNDLTKKRTEDLKAADDEKASLRIELQDTKEKLSESLDTNSSLEENLTKVESDFELLQEETRDLRDRTAILSDNLQKVEQERDAAASEKLNVEEKMTKEIEDLRIQLEDAKIEEAIEEKKKENLVEDLRRQLRRQAEKCEQLEVQARNASSSASAAASANVKPNSNVKLTEQYSRSRLFSASGQSSVTYNESSTANDPESIAASITSGQGRDEALVAENIQLLGRVADLEESMVLLNSELEQKSSIISEMTKKSKKTGGANVIHPQAGIQKSSKSSQKHVFKNEDIKKLEKASNSRKSLLGLRVKPPTNVEKEKLKRIDLILEETLQKNIKLHDDIYIMGETVDRLTDELERVKDENDRLRVQLRSPQ